ncbi:hypothetical protein [Streptomyces sp. CB01881]|uniref:hypothetical protein n=1 Tax=Streptomyces sp. CB01881 TaxID=2078691 RepID=UPI0011DFE1AA|nr:hypothetical protein [Streptomyces sp. CB01881]TYC68768.1 hypothetical protein EH183_38595 [Streptomyces sp. CB01881]
MSTWTSVSKLSIILVSGDETCDIYANGRNRIGVMISVAPTDKDGNPIEVDFSHLLNRMWLIDYVTESTLNWKGSSGWCYTDTTNAFTAAPGLSGERAEVSFGDDGTQLITFYVYCAPGVSPKSIGVQVKTDSDDIVKSSLNGTYQEKIKLNPRTAVTYMKGDITWDYSHTSTKYGGNTKYVTTDAWNYYLTLKSADNYFVTFSVSSYFSEDGYDGFFSSHITPDSNRKNFYGGYVWYREPHGSAYYVVENDGHSEGEVVNFPDSNKWWDYAKIYDRNHPERYLCFSWVHSITGGDGWHIPNGPLNTWQTWFTPQIVAYDRFGNAGTFWVDGSDITGGLNIYDHRP